MRAVFRSLLFIVCIYPANLFAAEVDLPELVGEYTSGDNITVSVDFGRPIADMSRVGLVIIASAETSMVVTETDTFFLGMKFTASFAEPDPGVWMAETDMWFSPDRVDYSFTYFSSLFGATSDFLADGRGEMYFEVAPFDVTGTIVYCGPPPWGTIYSAKLVFDDEVGAEIESWGEVKSLFR